MKIEINFEHPYMDAKIIEELTIADLDCFYADADEVSSLHLTNWQSSTLAKRWNGMRYQSIANGKKLSIWEIDNFQFV